MDILRTEDDGSVRALAIEFTQQQLGQALRDWADGSLDLARSTLVETTRGVFTIDAMLRVAGRAANFHQEVDRLAADADGQGLRAVAQGIRLVARGRLARDGQAPAARPWRPRPGLA